MTLYFARRVPAEDVRRLLDMQRDLGARRDLRLVGISSRWFFLGFLWCPRRSAAPGETPTDHDAGRGK